MHSGPITIAKAHDFQLDSYGNGAAYALKCCDGASVWLSGDDATQFREELDALERAHPKWPQSRILAWMWDECGYGSVADREI